MINGRYNFANHISHRLDRIRYITYYIHFDAKAYLRSNYRCYNKMIIFNLLYLIFLIAVSNLLNVFYLHPPILPSENMLFRAIFYFVINFPAFSCTSSPLFIQTQFISSAIFDCCKQSFNRLYHPPTHPSNHSAPDFIN